MFLDSHRTMFIFLSWLDLPCVVLAFWISILSIFKSLLNYWHRVTYITSFENVKKVIQIILWAFIQIWCNIVSRIYFWRNLSPRDSVFYIDLVYKLKRVKCDDNFVSSGSGIVKSFWHRKYDSVVIVRTIGLVLGPTRALYRSFLNHCTLTNKT